MEESSTAIPSTRGIRWTLGVMGTVGVLLALPYLTGALARFRLLEPLAPGEGLALFSPPPTTATVGEVALPRAEASALEHLKVPEHTTIPKRARTLVDRAAEEKPPVALEGDAHALDAFFDQLVKVDDGQPTLARVSVWGDSNVASDLVTSVLRRALQKRFGDGGHGFVLLTRTSKNYFHNDVRQIVADGWSVSAMTTPLARDGLYGLGATTFRSRGPGAIAKIGTATVGTFGRTCSRVVVPYLEQPGGGGFEVRVDGTLLGSVTTDAPQKRAKLATFTFDDAEHVIEIKSTATDARIFGLWLERAGPGVVVDALGVTNSKMRYLLRTDEAFMAEQIALRDPHLLVLNFGVNGAREGATLWGGSERYERDVRDVLARLRRHHPRKSCLVVSPGDAAASMGNNRVSFPLVQEIVDIQRRVAIASGCAFWNMHAAMGGVGSMARWASAGLGKPDLLHPSNAGATLLGRWLYLALMDRYATFEPEAVKTESR